MYGIMYSLYFFSLSPFFGDFCPFYTQAYGEKNGKGIKKYLSDFWFLTFYWLYDSIRVTILIQCIIIINMGLYSRVYHIKSLVLFKMPTTFNYLFGISIPTLNVACQFRQNNYMTSWLLYYYDNVVCLTDENGTNNFKKSCNFMLIF